jgi:hypothetical protein
LGTLPGKKFIWLKVEGVNDLDEVTLRINQSYGRLLELQEGDKVEASYKKFKFSAKVELSETIPKGKVQLNKEHLSSVPEGKTLLLMKPGKKKKKT